MKTAMDDRELIERFVADGSDGAFGELVARHINLVFSVAQRLLGGDRHRAQDVAQLVFINLARKAPALWGRQRWATNREPLVLSGWLHRDTYYTALRILRAERRRQQREQEAVAMNDLARDPEAVNWRQVAPVLDQALNSLDAADRDALLLRFFEQRSLVEIGDRLGIGESGASHRVARALEKLRLLLARYGITTTAAALSASIAAHGMQTAPVGLAAQLARASLAAATTSTSSLGILSLMTSTKLTVTLAILVGLALTGSVALLVRKSTAKQDGPTAQAFPARAKAGANPVLRFHGTLPKASMPADMDPALAAAVRKVHDALFAPGDDRIRPQPTLVEAITELGIQRKLALPLLREALRDSERRVRQRAIFGLMELRRDAAEALPDLLVIVGPGQGQEAKLAASAIGAIGPSIEMVPKLVQTVKDNPALASDILPLLTMFTYHDPSKVSEVASYLSPLLQETAPELRLHVASALASLKGQAAGTEVFQIALQAVQSNAGDSDLREALGTLNSMRGDSHSSAYPFGSSNLLAAAKDAIPTLIDIANNNTNEDVRFGAMALLDRLDPALRAANPPMDSALNEAKQGDTLRTKALGGEMSVPELIDALKQYPGEIAPVASALAKLGPNAQDALPALRDALNTLQPLPGRGLAASIQNGTRDAVANAIQAIAPDQPKPWFTHKDASVLVEVVEEARQQADPAQSQRMGQALLAGLPRPSQGLTPVQMRGLLESFKGIDATVYDALTAQVRKIDPHFFPKARP